MFPDLNRVVTMIVPLLFAVTVHESAHGAAALAMGDDTAWKAGRLSLNPLRHVDPVGSVLLPLILKLTGSPILFGYARPVPIDPGRFRNFRKGTIIVSAAGVAANLGLLMASALLFRALVLAGPTLYGTWARPLLIDGLLLCGYSVVINAVLAVFNLIPVPPLDGSRLLAMALPRKLRVSFERLDRLGMLLVVVLLLSGTINRVLHFFLSPILRLSLGADGLAFLFG